jgi:hypothetical protein
MADKHSGSGSGLFVRLANHGDSVTGAFVGEPYAREVHWGGERYEECTGDGCSFCGEGKKPSLRVGMNFFVSSENDMKIIEFGVLMFKDLLKVRDKYGLQKWFFEIERHGQAGDSKTRYSILPDKQIDKDGQAQIDGANLHDLPQVLSGGSNDRFDSYDKGDGGVIDAKTASELMPRLKALPRTALDGWLSELGIGKVRDLKTSDVKKARALLDRLEADQRSGDAGSEEIDPFA